MFLSFGLDLKSGSISCGKGVRNIFASSLSGFGTLCICLRTCSMTGQRVLADSEENCLEDYKGEEKMS